MSSIGSIGSSTLMQGMQSARNMKRPDPTQMAENLFSKLDTSGQGYIQKSDLQAAFDKISTSASSASSGSTSSVDDLFSKLDSDADGKVTKQEFSDVLAQVSEQLDNQVMGLRMNGGMPGGGMGGGMSGMGGMGGMPPPPPPAGDDTGFTQDELSSQLDEVGSSDSKRSNLISNIVDNFDEADTDDDGKVSFKEAMAFDQSGSSSSSATSSVSGTSSASSADTSADAKVMLQIMRLMQAYAIGADSGSAAGASLSVAA